MADSKKISQLHQISSLNTDDEFLVVDKSTKSGTDASDSGKTSRVTFDQLKNQIGSQGQKGSQGIKGPQGAASTVKGPRGDDGAKGNQSTVKGPRGEEGAKGNTISVKGQKGVQGDKGPKGAPSTVKGPTGAPSTVKGPKGPQGANSTVAGPKGPQGDKSTVKGPKGDKSTLKGPKGQQGNSASANGHLGLVGKNCAMSYGGHHLYKTGGTANWDGQVNSSVGYTGGCQLHIRPMQASLQYGMYGLNTSSSTSASFQEINYSFYVNHGKLEARKNGVNQKTIGVVKDTDVLSLTYDNYYIRWYFNGVQQHYVGHGSGARFYFDSSLHSPVSRTKALTSLISFIPWNIGQKGATGAKSTLKGPKGPTGDNSTVKGPKGDKSTEKGPKGDKSTVKGQKGERGVSFSFSNGVLKITS